MNVPGITSPDMSATINGAIRAGWEYIGTKSNHTVGQIRWPATGATVNFSTTPRSGGWKTTAELIFKESGVDLRRKGSSRRSRKRVELSGFDPSKAHRETDRFHETTGHDSKVADHTRLVGEVRAAIERRGGRDDAQIVRDHWPRIQALQDCLNKYGPVVEPFDLNSLGDNA